MNKLSPIVLFTYKRIDTLKMTVASLLSNKLARESDIHIFSDASKNSHDADDVKNVRKYLREITGFKQITIHEANINKGLANSVIEGISKVVDQYGKVIVLEDDLVVSENFLSYMNYCLNKYENNMSVDNISGFSFSDSFDNLKYNYDIFFLHRGCSWGWATWNNRWKRVRWKILENDNKFENIDSLGSDMPSLIKKYRNNKIDSWAVPWNINQFVNKTYTVYPVVSKVRNFGFSEGATHTHGQESRFFTTVDTSNSIDFKFPDDVMISNHHLLAFNKRFSLKTRVIYRFKKISIRNLWKRVW